MIPRYSRIDSTKCVHTPVTAFDFGYSIRATSYTVCNNKHTGDYRVVRVQGHFYDDDGDLFLTCRGLLFASDGGLRIAEASAGTMHCYVGGDKQFWFDGVKGGGLDDHPFFMGCGRAALEALERTLGRLDDVKHVQWGMFGMLYPSAPDYEPLDATDLNAYEQELEADHPTAGEGEGQVTCGGTPITCGNYSRFQSVGGELR